MKRIGLLGAAVFILLAVFGSMRQAAALDLAFERTWGGFGADSGEGVAVAADGSVYLVGHTTSFGTGADNGDLDIFLNKYSAAGDLLWQRTYGLDRVEAFLPASDYAADVEVGADGSVYVAGMTLGRFLLVKFDSEGALVWETTWGNGAEMPRAMDIGPDGSIYLVGFTSRQGAGDWDAVLAKFDANGTSLWQKTWGGLGFDNGDDVAVAADGSVYVAGDNNSFFANDAMLVKFDSEGSILWERNWREGTIQDISAATGVDVAPDGSVYLAGRSAIDQVGQNAFLVKWTSDGAVVWQKTWGNDLDSASGVAVAPDGSIFITGNTGYGAGSGDAFVVHFLPNGRVKQTAAWGGTDHESGQDIAIGPDGAIHVAGYTFGPPPYELGRAGKRSGRPDSFVGVPTGTVAPAVGETVDPNGIITTPEGSQTYSGDVEAVLLKLSL